MLRSSPEEIDEAGIRAVACDCGIGRDWWSTSRKCFSHGSVCVLHRRVCGFNKQGACLSHGVGEFVIEVETLRHQQSILPRNNDKPNQDVRMALQGDFEWLLDDDGLQHINTQIQRRSERQGRTPGFKDSNLNNLMMLNCER